MKFVGVLLIIMGVIGGIALAGYVAGYLMLYGGIVGAINACKDGIDASSLAGNIIKAIFWEAGIFAGIIGGAGSFLVGIVLWKQK